MNFGNQRLKDAGYHVGDDFVERWFAAEANLNPQLRHAFDMRYESPAQISATTKNLPIKRCTS